MAKETSQTKEASEKSSLNDPEINIKASVDDQELIEYGEKGRNLKFDFEDFRELSGDVLDELNHLSLTSYFTNRALFVKAQRKAKDEGEYGKSDGVIEVLGQAAGSRLRIDGLPKGLHGCWKLPEEVGDCKRQGYVTVDGRFAGVRAGDPTASGGHEIKKKDGKPSLILMAIPEDRYQDHIHGVSRISRKRVKGVAAKFSHKAKEVDKDVPTKLETTSEKMKVHG